MKFNFPKKAKGFASILIAVAFVSAMLPGCGVSSMTADSTSTQTTPESSGNGSTETLSTVTSSSNETLSSSGTAGAIVITQVYGDGQKAAAVAVQYPSAIDASSISADDFNIENYSITNVYTSSDAAIVNTNTEGNYVILILSTDYNMSNYVESGDVCGPNGIDTAAAGSGPGGNSSSHQTDLSGMADMSGKPSTDQSGMSDSSGMDSSSGFGGMSGISDSISNQITLNLTQTGDISAEDGTVYAASDSIITTDPDDNINLIVDDFQQLVYTADDGSTLMYNLYLPSDYESKNYPVVLFMPDATATSSDPVKTLTQGLGAVVWASAESQAENPCIVLAPQYTGSDETADTNNTVSLLSSVVSTYHADSDRLYVTGQSAGTIRAIGLMIDHPDLFAAAYLTAGQADDAYVNRLGELSGEKIWMICSGGDARAYPGMTAIQEAVEAKGIQVTDSAWSAKLSEDEQNAQAKTAENAGTSIIWTVLDSGSMIPDGVTDSDVTEHMNTWRVAYSISEIRDWLFKQSK